MPNAQHVNNRRLYQAAQKNNLNDVLLHLKNGAEVVDIRNNGTCNAEAVFHTYGFDENINLSSALHYALKHRHIEMVAYLAKSAQKNDVIDGALYRYAAYLDKNIASFLYVQALTNPDAVLKQLADKSAAETSGTMKLKQSASRDADNPFRLYDLQDMMFVNPAADKSGKDLNAAIAAAYLQARALYDSASTWTYRKKSKAIKIIDQLVYLHSLYENDERLPEVADYFAESSAGASLAALLQAKRVPNPFVLFSESWKEVQGRLPALGKLEENVIQKLKVIF